jgi:GNAT superfamily N-acetyltransferase
MISYRPADREKDFVFARQVHHRAYRDVVTKQFGNWNETMQDRFFADEWWTLPFKIILLDDAPIGVLSVRSVNGYLFIHEIQLLPEFQGRGVGTEILQEQITEAKQLALPLKLKVLRKNRAQELYKRMGFVPYKETDIDIFMKFEAGFSSGGDTR